MTRTTEDLTSREIEAILNLIETTKRELKDDNDDDIEEKAGWEVIQAKLLAADPD